MQRLKPKNINEVMVIWQDERDGNKEIYYKYKYTGLYRDS